MKLSYIIELDTLSSKFFGSTEFILQERTDTYQYYTLITLILLTPEPIDLITGAVRWLLIGSGR